jgi:hypothetical protein
VNPTHGECPAFFDGLDFDDYTIFDQEIDSIAGIEPHSAINDRQADLAFELQTIASHFVE